MFITEVNHNFYPSFQHMHMRWFMIIRINPKGKSAFSQHCRHVGTAKSS